MKKLFLIALTTVTFAACNNNAKTEETTMADDAPATTEMEMEGSSMAGAVNLENGDVMMKDGKMMMMKDGAMMNMDKDMTMSNGTMVMMNGDVKMSDGKMMKMSNGQMMRMNGDMMDENGTMIK